MAETQSNMSVPYNHGMFGNFKRHVLASLPQNRSQKVASDSNLIPHFIKPNFFNSLSFPSYYNYHFFFPLGLLSTFSLYFLR